MSDADEVCARFSAAAARRSAAISFGLVGLEGDVDMLKISTVMLLTLSSCGRWLNPNRS